MVEIAWMSWRRSSLNFLTVVCCCKEPSPLTIDSGMSAPHPPRHVNCSLAFALFKIIDNIFCTHLFLRIFWIHDDKYAFRHSALQAWLFEEAGQVIQRGPHVNYARNDPRSNKNHRLGKIPSSKRWHVSNKYGTELQFWTPWGDCSCMLCFTDCLPAAK